MPRSSLLRAVLAALVLATAGCASSGQVRRLETRIAALEAAQAARADEDARARVDLESRMLTLRLEVARLTTSAIATDDRVARLERQPAPTPRPSRPTHDPAAVYAVPVAGAPALGPDDALVTIVGAGEYACPYCEKVRATLDELRAIYGNRLRIVARNYVVHPVIATIPAQAACAAHRQRRFWDMDHLLWERAFKTRTWDQPHLETLAAELGLDLDRFRADLAGPCATELRAELAMLERFGVRATPAFFVNGRFLSGAQPVTAFQALIDEELAKAQERMKKSRKRVNYHDQWVLGTGLPGLAAPGSTLVGPSPAATP